MSALPSSTDVVIVGAGPVGLALAGVLASEGISLVIVDRLAEGANTSRAVVVHARTLEVLEKLNVTDQLCAQGHIVPRFTVRDRDNVLVTIRFDTLPTRYPYTLMIPQNVTEAILLGHLRELGSDVYRPYEVTELSQDADGISVAVNNSTHLQMIRAKYVVGADGMHSTVRERAGIGFIGDTYEQSFVLADVRMNWPLSDDEVTLFYSPGGLVVVSPMPGGRHRVVASMDDAPKQPSIGDVQRLLDTRGPMAKAARIDEVIWSSRFRIHHRVANRYRSGRILLAGDAAHVHSPAGGQGMNTGIQDAVVLGRILAAVVAKRTTEGQLDEYGRIRRPVAERVVAFTHRMTRLATLRNRRAQSVRNALIGMITRIPAVRRWLATELAELRYR